MVPGGCNAVRCLSPRLCPPECNRAGQGAAAAWEAVLQVNAMHF